MSYLVPPQISEQEQVNRSQALFETHRERQLQRYYPPSTLYNLAHSNTIEVWSDQTTILKDLEFILPFGEVLKLSQFQDFASCDLQRLGDLAQEQLLYWHLAKVVNVHGSPIESFLLWNKDDYLWFIHIAPRCECIIQDLLSGEHQFFLERFRLDYEQVQISFQEIRLETTQFGPRLVITEGREYTLKWDGVWETTLENPDTNIVNPQIFHLPPDTPDDIDFVTRLNILETGDESLPPSSPPSPRSSPSPPAPDTDTDSGWGEPANQWISNGVCWCSKEVCTCGYRPNTPPTPPSVVLWAPGQDFLPFRERI